jgi:hypothetical protein
MDNIDLLNAALTVIISIASAVYAVSRRVNKFETDLRLIYSRVEGIERALESDIRQIKDDLKTIQQDIKQILLTKADRE